MKIIEYQDKYAGLVADMWNRSGEAWGNDDELKTEQDVIVSEKNSGNLKVYLAMDKGQVIGYCSFSEYKQDEGASYLPLINVRPDYHGKKIGKALILKVLEDAKQAKWPRFDLYTWSGNIKAMPLYKKCGFFWERRNNTVHLMNFIPYLYQTDALKPYLEDLDLYEDNKRKIDMDYDGEEVNGFDIYQYDFKNDHTYLSLGFEKTGRGLVFVDNPDYTIKLSLPKHKLIHETKNQATLHIENKMNEPLNIQVSGNNNKNIINDFHTSVSVEKSKVLKMPFYIETTQKKQDPGKTHPCFDVDLVINGKNANFMCGLITKNPISINLNTIHSMHEKGKTYNAYIDLENNLDHKATFSIHFPSTNVEFNNDIEITLDKDERKSIKLAYQIKYFGYYKENVKVKYGDVLFKSPITAMFKGLKESYVCDLDKDILIVSGNSIARYHKESHNLNFSNDVDEKYDIGFMSPKIGMPYSLEFNNQDPSIHIVSDNKIIVIFKSNSFPDVYLNMHIENNHGLLEVYYELINKGKRKDLSLSIPLYKSLSHSVLPFKSKLLKIEEYGGFIANIDAENIDENWMFNDQLKQGFSWPKDVDVKVSDWHMSFDFEDLTLDKDQTFISKPFIVSTIHPKLKDFREFLSSFSNRQTINYMELEVNSFNPFIKDHAQARLINHRKAQIEGTITNNDKTYDLGQFFNVSPGLQSFEIEVKDRLINERRLLYKVSGKVETSQSDSVYSIDNGLMVYKADLKHSDSIFSLVFDGEEWLDSNYPEPKERAWWADFVGGITQRIQGIQDIVAIKEERDIDFVSQEDKHGNQWTGIKIRTHYKSDPILKGVSTENYFMTMPGVPLLYSYTKVINQSGKIIMNKFMNRRYTLDPDREKGKINFLDSNTIYKVGDQAIDINVKQHVCLKSTRTYNINIYGCDNDYIFDSQKEYIMFFAQKKMTIPDQESKVFKGDFLFFTKEDIKKDDLKLFDYISLT